MSNQAIEPPAVKIAEGDSVKRIVRGLTWRSRRVAIGLHDFKRGYFLDVTSWRVDEHGIAIPSGVKCISLPAPMVPELFLGIREVKHQLELLGAL